MRGRKGASRDSSGVDRVIENGRDRDRERDGQVDRLKDRQTENEDGEREEKE